MSRLPSLRRWALTLPSVIVMSGACGVATDGQPRDLPGGERVSSTPNAPTLTAQNSGAERVYFISPESETKPARLRAVSGDFGTEPRDLLDALLAGPSQQQIAARLSSSVPNATAVITVRRENGGLLIVDLTDQFLELPLPTLSLAVAQIVYTCFEASEVRGVLLKINGERHEWQIDGAIIDRALTTYDFPNYVESSQQDFPSLPSE